MSFVGSLIRTFVERQASSTGLDGIRKGLETGGEQLAGQMASAPDTPANREQAGHVIGIERWAAHRMRSALSPAASSGAEGRPAVSAASSGAEGRPAVPATPPVMDEYDGYRPAADLPLSALAPEFRAARAETLALLEALHDLQDCRVPHNELGPLTVRGWLYYLIQHAKIEGIRIR